MALVKNFEFSEKMQDFLLTNAAETVYTTNRKQGGLTGSLAFSVYLGFDPVSRGESAMSNFIITISRGYGSGGKTIGKQLAAQLGIPFYENQIPEVASALRSGEPAAFRGKKLTRALNRIPARETACDSFVSDDSLFQAQTSIIQELAKKDSCVIVGMCANYLLRTRSNVLSVYVGAPESACVETVQKQFGLSQEEANQVVGKVDRYRSDYYTYYTGGERWNDPMLYDLTLNTANMDYDDATRTILNAAKVKFGDNLRA